MSNITEVIKETQENTSSTNRHLPTIPQDSTKQAETMLAMMAKAKSPQEAYELYYSNYATKVPLIFTWKGSTYSGYTKESKQEDVKMFAVKAVNGTLEALYTLVDESLPYRAKSKHRLKFCLNGGVGKLELTAEEFSKVGHFETALEHYGLTFYLQRDGLKRLTTFLIHGNPLVQRKVPRIREVKTTGYDRKSNCFVFDKFLYTPEGKRITLDKDGYFKQAQIAPMEDKGVIQDIQEINVNHFLSTLFDAYGAKGLLALGFWVSSLFSHLVFKKYRLFPFLSLFGDSNCGKSALTTILNRCFFMDWEGITMTKANTVKGELRKIAQKSSLVTPMLEGRKDKTKFDFESTLPLYNRNPLYTRAQTTQGNEIHEVAFEASLAFVQNVEQFNSKPSKERVISLYFSEDKLTDESFEAWKTLETYSPEQLAGVGHSILIKRQFFEENLINSIESITETLKATIGNHRIARNHAIALAGSEILCEVFHSDETKKSNLAIYTKERAETKVQTARTESLLADHFFEALFQEEESEHNLLNNGGYRIRAEEILVHLTTALKKLGWTNRSEIMEALKLHDAFQNSQKKVRGVFSSEPTSCWLFKNFSEK